MSPRAIDGFNRRATGLIFDMFLCDPARRNRTFRLTTPLGTEKTRILRSLRAVEIGGKNALLFGFHPVEGMSRRQLQDTDLLGLLLCEEVGR